MTYEIAQDKLYVYEWLVTARDEAGEIAYRAAFRGKDAERHAREYVDWKSMK